MHGRRAWWREGILAQIGSSTSGVVHWAGRNGTRPQREKKKGWHSKMRGDKQGSAAHRRRRVRLLRKHEPGLWKAFKRRPIAYHTNRCAALPAYKSCCLKAQNRTGAE